MGCKLINVDTPCFVFMSTYSNTSFLESLIGVVHSSIDLKLASVETFATCLSRSKSYSDPLFLYWTPNNASKYSAFLETRASSVALWAQMPEGFFVISPPDDSLCESSTSNDDDDDDKDD